MREIIRVMLLKPNSDRTLMIPLQRPLEWDSVLCDFYQSIMDTDDAPPATLMDECKILVHPNKSKQETGVVIRKSRLDTSIRDGDLLSLEGFDPLNISEFLKDIDLDLDKLTTPDAPNDFPVVPSIPQAVPLVNSQPPTGSTPVGTPSRKTKRGRSLSSKFWLVNKLAQSEKITKEQKDALKMMLIMDDSIVHAAFEEFERTGNVDTLLNAQLNSKRFTPNGADPLNFDITQNIENGLDSLSMITPDVTGFPELPDVGVFPSTIPESTTEVLPDPSDGTASSKVADALLDDPIDLLLSDLPMPIGCDDGRNSNLPSALPGDLHGMEEWLKD